MKKVLILSGALILLAGCSMVVTEEPKNSDDTMQAYNESSWETIIPESCQSFTDGCNTCRRGPQEGIAACTKKFCLEYSKPECLD